VDEEVLDKLYDFDYAMLEGVDSVATSIDALAEAVEEDGDISSQADALVDQLTNLNNSFGRRQDVILD
jgi:hypothetical protein